MVARMLSRAFIVEQTAGEQEEREQEEKRKKRMTYHDVGVKCAFAKKRGNKRTESEEKQYQVQCVQRSCQHCITINFYQVIRFQVSVLEVPPVLPPLLSPW